MPMSFESPVACAAVAHPQTPYQKEFTMSSEKPDPTTAREHNKLAAELQRRLQEGRRLGFRQALPTKPSSGLRFLTSDSRRLATCLDALNHEAFRDLASAVADSPEILQRRMEEAETSVIELVNRLQAFLARVRAAKEAASGLAKRA